MKKKLFALSGVFLIVLVITGLWATRATDLLGGVEQTSEPGAATSRATGLSMEAMTVGAEAIVIGKGLDTRSVWINRRLVTLARVSVTEILKGDPTSEVTVVLPGGADSNRRIPIGMIYPGAPHIDPGEEVALFLIPDEVANGYTVMGFNQGKFPIANDDEGGKVITPDSTRVLVQKGAGVKRGNLPTIPLEEFKARVKGYLNK